MTIANMRTAEEKKAEKARRKREKVSFVQRIRNRIHEIIGLGQLLVNEPRAFPGELWRTMKRSLRSLWNARGGGLYACGFVVTFVWLEVKTVAGEVIASDSALAFVTQQFFETIFRLISDSFVNSLLAFIWPAFVLEWSPTWGIVILAALWILFPRFIKPLLAGWLFDEEEAVTPATDDAPRPRDP